MIKSMTGFGRAHEIIDGREILVEIRSVNHRYFEFNTRIPRTYGYLEEKLKSFIQQNVSRGKIEVSVSIFMLEGTNEEIQLNRAVAAGYVQALRSVKEELSLVDDLTLSNIARFQDIFTVHKVIENEEEIWQAVKPVVQSALKSFIQMRAKEGERLKADLLLKLKEIRQSVNIIEQRAPQATEEYREKLYDKLSKLLEEKDIDEARILTETAIFAEKTDVDEEVVRLNSHVEQFEQILDIQQPVGRKFDFIVQEINREVNTIGSKVSDIELSKIVIELKSVIEKIREQIQNIE